LKKGDPTKIYKKIDSSGQGGFGKVFYAKNLENKLTVAIKRIQHECMYIFFFFKNSFALVACTDSISLSCEGAVQKHL